jgi:hypothetical protein
MVYPHADDEELRTYGFRKSHVRHDMQTFQDLGVAQDVVQEKLYER